MPTNSPRVRGRGASLVTILTLAALMLSAMITLPAETVRQSEFRPLSPEILGQGGSYVAVAEGYDSLYTNPAGLARTVDPEITLASLRVWTHSRPDLLLPTIGALGGEDISSDGDGDGGEQVSRDDLIIDALREQFTTNGFGIGSALGVGYVGNRIGVGMNVAGDSYLYGDTFPLGLEGEISSQFTLVFGYAQPFQLGPVELIVGGALRPSLRVSSLVGSGTAADLITNFTGVVTGDEDDEEGEDILSSINALNGWGVAFDAGLLAGYRAFSVGVQARNLFNTSMQYSRNSLDDLFSALASGGLPSSPDEEQQEYVADRYIVPMALSVGAAWQPDLGDFSDFVDPEVHVQLADPFAAADIDPHRPNSFWTRMHMGTELRFLRFFDLRFGINQGYFTLGTGLDLMFLDMQFALFSQEFGRHPGDRQVDGAALEFALRF